MEQRTENLDEIESLTLSHYDQNAEAFWNGTKDHDVTQNYEAFLAPFLEGKKLDILDLGCGPGRDEIIFSHWVTGQLVSTAARHSVIWPAGTRVVRFFIKSFLAWNYPCTLSMASSPMPLCFMFPVRNCHESFMTYTPH